MATEKNERPSMLFNDAIFAETIKKEMRVHKLYENYMLTPSKLTNLVITKKPTGDPTVKGAEIEDSEYTLFFILSHIVSYNLYKLS